MSRKIYFCGSIRAGRQDVELYGRLVTALRQYGTVLTEFVADPSVTGLGSNEGTATTDREIHDRDVRCGRLRSVPRVADTFLIVIAWF